MRHLRKFVAHRIRTCTLTRTHIEHAQTRARHVCACDLAGKHILTCERTHLCIDINKLHLQAHARIQAQEQAPAHTNALARNTHKRRHAGCVHAPASVCVSTQQRHTSLLHTGKRVRFRFRRSCKCPGGLIAHQFHPCQSRSATAGSCSSCAPRLRPFIMHCAAGVRVHAPHLM